MVRTIIIPTENTVSLSIPEEYVGKTIEVTFHELDGSEQPPAIKTMMDFWGIISDQTAETLYNQVKQSRNEWNNDF